MRGITFGVDIRLLRMENIMDRDEFIINTAKEILLSRAISQLRGTEGVGNDFKLLVTKVREAVDSLEKPTGFSFIEISNW